MMVGGGCSGVEVRPRGDSNSAITAKSETNYRVLRRPGGEVTDEMVLYVQPADAYRMQDNTTVNDPRHVCRRQ